MTIAVLGAGAFGTALAIALARENDVQLWCRSLSHARAMKTSRENQARLSGVTFPDRLNIQSDLSELSASEVVLLAIPMQKLRAFLEHSGSDIGFLPLVACCKGAEIGTGLGPVSLIRSVMKTDKATILTGPSFAADIANGLPTALTLACDDEALGAQLQQKLRSETLRLYRSTDTVGAELGGALKNVMAIGCGAVIGAGLGESARAALMTRGYAEMLRFATARGAKPETLAGLSGFGDLALTCTSLKSRNYQRGLALGGGETWDGSTTVEGAATAIAISEEAARLGIDMPITTAITRLLNGKRTVSDTIGELLARPLRKEV